MLISSILVLYLRKNVWTTEDQFGLAVPLG